MTARDTIRLDAMANADGEHVAIDFEARGTLGVFETHIDVDLQTAEAFREDLDEAIERTRANRDRRLAAEASR